MKNKLVVVALVGLTALCLSVPVLAQDALSLESLSEKLQALTDKVTALTERMDSIEALWINSEPVVLLDGSCILGTQGGLQDSTVLKYKEEFDAWPDVDEISVKGVNYNPETDIIGIQYGSVWEDHMVIEFWQGCEFLESTDWWDGDFGEEAFEGYEVPGK